VPIGLTRDKKEIYTHICAKILKSLIAVVVVAFLIIMILEPVSCG